MVDQHQLYALIAKAICDIRKDDRERQMDLEEAKQIAKCVLEALAGAGFEIRPVAEK
jgi:predicted ATPase